MDGFYSSHRIQSAAHHRGFSIYGQPTGKRLKYRVIADCAVKENKIVEEWLVRDDLSIIRQIGLDERAFVAKLVHLAPEKYSTTRKDTTGQQSDIPELPSKAGAGFDIEDFIKRAWHGAWNLRRFDRFVEAYISTIHCHSASGRELFGQDDIIQFAINWLACFPDGKMRFDHFCALGDDQKGYRTSLRMDIQRDPHRLWHLRRAEWKAG